MEFDIIYMGIGLIGGIGLGISALSAGANLLKGFPDFPISASDVNKEIDNQMNRALSEAASGTRRRLIGAGQEGSGVIDSAINTNQNRIRNFFEGERQKALRLLRQAQFQRDVAASQQLSETLSGLTDIGFSAFVLDDGLGEQKQGGGGFPGVPQQLKDFVNFSQFGPQNAAEFSQPIQPIQPRLNFL